VSDKEKKVIVKKAFVLPKPPQPSKKPEAKPPKKKG